jgi:hypothetical protein
MFGGT